ncbi:DUF6119 family protein [Novosphingobium sp.]|uniref:DUF6119 family protein n=1 Tax=Novosphingobium sp. TaxID=1874826 RepID=UPI002735379C|nr:DUF6119 family protein [Novosphingobium sp.]MDP3908352.1 TIGR04141 family sporadically distributed protein [Novosphingobium sp.]
MTKTRSFSIFLLKDGVDATNALKDDHALEEGVASENLPEGAVLYVLDNVPRPPWWRAYFGVQKDLNQVSKGALVFLQASGRWFALSFGHVFHNLKDSSYEYDFGLRVTLNCVDPAKLRSTDILEPSGAKRQRTQLPTAGDLTFFDVDADSTILKSLTGKVKDEHQDLFKSATGSSNIRISSAIEPAGLVGLCEQLLNLYDDDTYKTAFPDIQNIAPVRDPSVIAQLNGQLLTAFQARDEALALSVPDIVDFGDGLWGTFTGANRGDVYDDIFMHRYYEYLDAAGADLNAFGIDDLKRHQLVLTNEDGSVVRDRHSIFKSLIYDTTMNGGADNYHFCEGNWYLVDSGYVNRLRTYLDPLCKDTTLPDFNHDDEGAYNIAASAAAAGRVCLDKTNISIVGQKQVEPCDIYEVVDDQAVLHCVKISTLSAQLSHLFNQGTNSVNLMRSEQQALENMKALVGAGRPDPERDALVAPLANNKFRVVFGIVTHKDKADLSNNLPLFSRISLMRCMKELRRMGVDAEYCFIPDTSPATAGKTRKRKKKAAEPEAGEE